MRTLFTIVLLAGLAWAGYWFIGASAMEGTMKSWLDDRRAVGWVADYTRLNTAGFPNRFDTTITDLQLADPETGVALSIPHLEVLQLSYKPNHLIARLPQQQTVSTPLQKITMDSKHLMASVVFDPGIDMVLNRMTYDIQGLSLNSTLGWAAQIDSGLLATRQHENDPLVHDLSFEAKGLKMSEDMRKRLDPSNLLPDTFSTFAVKATAGFTAPWDRHAIEDQRPQPTMLDIELAQATWGDLDLKLAGQLAISADGIPEGQITVKATNWREMIGIARASGALPDAFVPAITRALELASGLSGNPKTLDVPLRLTGGQVRLGPISLGPAPRLTIR